MVVMKFGGSSLASADSIRRVISNVRSESSRHPVVVASAMGDTTDCLLALLSAARKGNSYSAWKLQEAIKNRHFAACKELLHGDARSAAEKYLQDTFRDLHVRMLELSEGERAFSRELQDWTTSLGEQLSSHLLAFVLQEHCGETVHFDSRKLIVTDSTFTNAKPLYCETYARIRPTVTAAARDKLVVLAGFIGANEKGHTTTLGRGGSDFTASIVGAAVHADEIQVWKDVDGMLTCDPRLLSEGCQVRRLSYEEASELANAGATILHPETMAPAQRLGIPIVIRNTFCPSGEGTRIESNAAQSANLIKSIAVKNDVALFEVRCASQAAHLQGLVRFSEQHGSEASVLSSSDRVLYIAVNESSKIPGKSLAPDGCLGAQIRSHQAIFTLVGQVSEKEIIERRVAAALQGIAAFVIPVEASSYSVRVAVPQMQLKTCLHLVHEAFFANPDPQFFVAQNSVALNRVSQDAGTPNRSATRPSIAAKAASARHRAQASALPLPSALLQAH